MFWILNNFIKNPVNLEGCQSSIKLIIVLTGKFGFNFDQLPNITDHNRMIKFDYVQLLNIWLPALGLYLFVHCDSHVWMNRVCIDS